MLREDAKARFAKRRILPGWNRYVFMVGKRPLAHDLMHMEAVPVRREPIAEDVKRAVWRRDDGRCVRCGSRELIQFDHVIPAALGGSTTAQNLQVLCADCNRAKGDSL